MKNSRWIEVKNRRVLFLKMFAIWIIAIYYQKANAYIDDCDKAKSDVEKLICSDKNLSTLDSNLNTLYSVVLSNANPIDKPTIVSDEKSWLINIRNRCEDASCVTRVYEDRLMSLSLVKAGTATASYVFDENHRKFVIDRLTSDLNKAGLTGQIKNCSRLLAFTPSNGIPLSRPDAINGGICQLNNRTVMLCNDSMVGNLTIKLYGFSSSSSGLLKFMEANCSD